MSKTSTDITSSDNYTAPPDGRGGNVTNNPNKAKRGKSGKAERVDDSRLPFLRKDLNKWVDFDPFKYTVDGIGVFTGEPLRVFQ